MNSLEYVDVNLTRDGVRATKRNITVLLNACEDFGVAVNIQWGIPLHRDTSK